MYFNEMNLAVKSPLLSRRPPHLTISPDAMRLLIEVRVAGCSKTFSDKMKLEFIEGVIK